MNKVSKLKELASNFTVLYVEDDSSLRAQLTKYLAKLFKVVISVNNGEAGLQKYKEKKFDLVITDIKMPKINGIEMVQKIKKLNSDQKIIITSAHTDASFFLDAIRLNVSGYILKPIDYTQMNEELLNVTTILYQAKENALYKKDLEKIVKAKTKEVHKLALEKVQNYELTLFALVDMIESRDSYTAGHSHRVATYSKMIAQAMGYSVDECDLIFKAGILHDIGKISTPDAILLKPDSLTTLEYALIQDHVSVGHQILHKIPMYKELSQIIYDHHEKCDGSGYPRGLKDEEIHPLARIMSVADAFDAMTTNRIYKRKKSIDEALTEIESLKNIHYCWDVVEVARSTLQDIETPSSTTQTPSSALEQERFAYFFKDQTTNTYNKFYLESILVQNSVDGDFCCCDMIYLHNFTALNNKFGWSVGDEVLKEFAAFLIEHYDHSLVFRLYGDDFLILHTKNCHYDDSKIEQGELLQKYGLNVTIKHINLYEESINSLSDIERFFNV